ncbi:site-2 protease family protein [Blastopirellula marina]|uniref:Peptidase M50 domain-containing protein n=1 Tax=Blastopirellula marina DSM 3645 TaxID=314230 RepID=A3ZRW2_9BACT|nr:site-2 protease family protein [Blastopirellula marina]EAQ80881.1 hypothetical protein DSM3645_12711 [Blastopirellula marina DSM 3645]
MANVYQLNSPRASLREFAFELSWPLMPIAWIIKIFGIRTAGSTDDPAVDRIDEFVTEREWPANIETKLAPELAMLAGLGFRQAVRHEVTLPSHNTTIYRVTMLHETSKCVARVQYRIWRQPALTTDKLTRQIETPLQDGSYLITFGGQPDLLAPDNFLVERCGKKKTFGQLWQRHQERLAESIRPARELYTREDLLDYIHEQHEELIAFHVKRGLFDRPEPLDPAYTSSTASSELGESDPGTEPIVAAVTSDDPQYRDVFAELDKLEKNQSSWGAMITMLVISFLLFAAAIGWQQDFTALLLLAPILLFHEAGHFLAMKLFGYRDTKMFFIPFFGAAVSGRHLNVAGWKKGLVSMAGPVPGIFVGGAIGIWALFQPADWKFQLALATLLINGLNMLPILPLDGGAFWQAILFCRHRFLDVAFRGAAIAGLGLIALATGSYLFGFIGITMALALPTAYRIASAVERLRAQGFAAISNDGKSIPRDEAITLIDDIHAHFPEPHHPKIIAQHVYAVFESLNAKAPGVLATLALGMLYCGSFLACLILLAVIFVGRDSSLQDLLDLGLSQPETFYDADSQRSTEVGPLAGKTITYTSQFADKTAAAAEYDRLAKSEGPLRLLQIGPTLFVTAPAEGEATDALFDQLEAVGGEPFASTQGALLRTMTIALTASDSSEMLNDAETFQTIPFFVQAIAPWSPSWDAAAAEQRESWRKSRKAFAELRQADYALDAPELKNLESEMDAALRRGDEKRLSEIQEQHQKLLQQKHREAKDAKIATLEDPAMKELLAAYYAYETAFEERPSDFFAAEEGVQVPRQKQPEHQRLIEAAAILGQLPERQEIDWNDPPRYFVYGETAGPILMLKADTTHPEQLLPEWGAWYERRKCADTKYDVLAGGIWEDF